MKLSFLLIMFFAFSTDQSVLLAKFECSSEELELSKEGKSVICANERDPIGEGGFSTVFSARSASWRCPKAVRLVKSKADYQHDLPLELKLKKKCEKVKGCLERFLFVEDYGIYMDQHGFQRYVMTYPKALFDLGKIAPYLKLDQNKSQNDIRLEASYYIFHYLLETLGFLSDLGKAHMDVHPGNIVVVPKKGGFHLNVIDFGCVKPFFPTRSWCGKPNYHAPEIFRAKFAAFPNPKSDRYSLAMTIIFVLLGKAFHANSFDQEKLVLEISDFPTTATKIQSHLTTNLLRFLSTKRSQRVIVDELGADYQQEALISFSKIVKKVQSKNAKF